MHRNPSDVVTIDNFCLVLPTNVTCPSDVPLEDFPSIDLRSHIQFTTSSGSLCEAKANLSFPFADSFPCSLQGKGCGTRFLLR